MLIALNNQSLNFRLSSHSVRLESEILALNTSKELIDSISTTFFYNSRVACFNDPDQERTTNYMN